jgi:hypothetical protein
MVLSNKAVIKRMSNKDLIALVNKIRQEKANPKVYGKYGTSKFVTASEFWYGHHGDILEELRRRKKQGRISKLAGLMRKKKR